MSGLRPPHPRSRAGRRPARERGQTTVEFLGLLPSLIIVILMCLQVFITVAAYERTHNAARTAARVAAMQGYGEGEAQGWRALPGWLIEDSAERVCSADEDPDTDDCQPACADGENPSDDDCLPQDRCVRDGDEKPWERTCVEVFTHAAGGITGWVRTEIPVLFPGSPLVFPIEQTVEMPG